MMNDIRWRIDRASTAQLLELLWQIWDRLNRCFRFMDGPIRCHRQCESCSNRCCHHSHSMTEESRHEWYGPHRCFIHDDNGYEYL